MKILAIDTSAKVSSVCIVSDEKILAEFNIHTTLTHSQTLLPMIDYILKCSNTKLSEIDGYACANGPGSFTGLRIGIGAIKGLAYGQDKPCIEVSTLLGLAYNLSGIDGIVCAVMDARCNQVYNAIFENGERITEDRALTIDELMSELKAYNKKIFLVGDGANLCYNKFKGEVKDIVLTNELLRYQKASSIGLIALQKLKNGEALTAQQLAPSYIRLPQAERERRAKESEKI